MDIDEDDFRPDFGEQEVCGSEGVVVGLHEDPPLKIKNGIRYAGREGAFIKAVAGSSGGEIGRADDTAGAFVAFRWHGSQIFNDLPFVPDMVACCQDVSPQVEEVFGDGRGEAEAAGGIFSVHDDEINLAFPDEVR